MDNYGNSQAVYLGNHETVIAQKERSIEGVTTERTIQEALNRFDRYDLREDSHAILYLQNRGFQIVERETGRLLFDSGRR